ncbi:MAG: TIGR03435 family protein [Acidobacteriia bacterium]|nr:TIGR03435 family protein [Terriglobia bacterium]
MTAQLTNHLWQSTVLAAAAGLLTVAFRRNQAQVRYWLWLCASVKFLVPFAVLLSLGSQLDWAPAARKVTAPEVTPAVSFTVAQVIEPFPAGAPTAPAPQDRGVWIGLAILGVWAGGFLGSALLRMRGWRRVRAAVRDSTRVEIPVGFGRQIACPTVQVRSAPGLLEPGVVGWWRPMLLLPAGIAERLTPRQLEAVLAHEFCHVHRRDNLWASIHMMVEAVFWFHPLVWWIGARLVEERERACDEAVLSLGSEPRDYAEGILNVCKLYVESPLSCVSGVTGSDLKRRIHTILTGRIARELTFAKKAALAVAGVATLSAPVWVGMMNAPAMRAQTAAPAAPKFEVASVKPCVAGGSRIGTKQGPPGGAANVSQTRISTGCAALAAAYPIAGLIQRVYGRLGLSGRPSLGSALPIQGGPGWLYSDYYVINAATESKTSKETMEGPMLQALLEDRFHLKVHRETRQVRVYTLTVAKGGPKIPVADGSCVRPDYSTYPLRPAPPGKTYCKDLGVGGRKGPNTTVNEEEVTVDYFCKLLGLVLDRPILDKTGLTGKYNFHLEFAVDQSTPGVLEGFGPPSDAPPAASIFTVVQQQLGLKLEATKGPREFLVIDHVERPSEN